MGMWEWVRRLFKPGPDERSGIPEVIGHFTDDRGQKVALRRGPFQHAALSPDQIQRVARLRDVLAEAYPMTLEGWIDGFLRDTDPEKEIQIIEACAVVYQQLISRVSLSSDEEMRLYAVLCAVSSGSVAPQLASLLPPDKGLPDLDTLASLYQAALDSGTRPEKG